MLAASLSVWNRLRIVENYLFPLWCLYKSFW